MLERIPFPLSGVVYQALKFRPLALSFQKVPKERSFDLSLIKFRNVFSKAKIADDRIR